MPLTCDNDRLDHHQVAGSPQQAQATPHAGSAAARRHRCPVRGAQAAAEHAAMSAQGVVVGELRRWDGVPPMFSFDDPDGNRFYVVEDQQ
jgi:predicted enzyme related to lactoylglutathione lyase